ncbi:DUF6894 family protein [Methylobacterium oxalidis]|uniref:DUF6894 family protein n=1 Tax=Methylobacterium oxalidis TaxID=944322 RepID=UPI0033164737
MTQRFYFDLVNRETVISDPCGIEASDLEAAVVAAEAALQELRVTGEVHEFDGAWTLLIRDECGTLIQRLEIMAYLGVIYLGGYLLGVFLFLSEI